MMLVPHGLNKSAHVHAGFAFAYESVKDVVLKRVAEQVALYKGYDVIVTGMSSSARISTPRFTSPALAGHSMGGSLAALASMALKANMTDLGLRVYTFGMLCCPKKDIAFADRDKDNRGRVTPCLPIC
jgi:predicted lipase